MFYVYEHVRPDTGQCFYVGKGKGRRAWDMRRGRNRHHKAIQKSLASRGLEVEVRIILDGLEETAALGAEVTIIALHRANGVALVNYTDGGNGACGFKHTDESRRARSISMLGNRRSLGKKHGPSAKLKVSAARKGKPLSAEHRAKLSAAQNRRFKNPEERKKISASLVGRSPSKEAIEKISARSRQLAGDDAYIEKLRKGALRAWADPEKRSRILDGRRRAVAVMHAD